MAGPIIFAYNLNDSNEDSKAALQKSVAE